VLLAAPFLGRNLGGWLAWLSASHHKADKRAIIRWDSELLRLGLVSPTAVGLLQDCRFDVRVLDDLHAKVVVVGDWAYIGSANLTDRGIGGLNQELGVRLSGPRATDVAEVFHAWFEHATPLDSHVVEKARGREPAHPMLRDREIGGPKHEQARHHPRSPAPPSYRSYVRHQHIQEAMLRLQQGLVQSKELPGVRQRRMVRTRAYRDVAALRFTGETASETKLLRMLLQVLRSHKDPNARAHAAFRLGFDPWTSRSDDQISAALQRAESRDPTPVLRRATHRARAHRCWA
jgi:hypothetical protein